MAVGKTPEEKEKYKRYLNNLYEKYYGKNARDYDDEGNEIPQKKQKKVHVKKTKTKESDELVEDSNPKEKKEKSKKDRKPKENKDTTKKKSPKKNESENDSLNILISNKRKYTKKAKPGGLFKEGRQ